MKENTFKVIIAGTRDFRDYQFLCQTTWHQSRERQQQKQPIENRTVKW